MKTSKLCLTFLVALAVLSMAATSYATLIADWTFDITKPTTAGPILAETGSGTGTASHASTGAATYSAPVGNGSTNSWSANSWAVGDYWQFAVSCADCVDVTIDWDHTGSNTGPRDFILQYSTDGTNFTTFGSQYSIVTPLISWNGTTAVSTTHHTALVNALDGAATGYFRIVANTTTTITGGTLSGTGGTSRLDNVAVTCVPEPATFVLGAIGLGLAGLVSARRYRRK